MSICVIGGAGYIGSVVVECLQKAGRRVIVYDNLSRGHRKAVFHDTPFVEGDHGDAAKLKAALEKYECDVVMHFSALSLVGESVKNPLLYYDNNVSKGVALLEASVAAGVKYFIFSSTAAVYGEPVSIPIRESDPTVPNNPYGNTKLAFERLLHDVTSVARMSFVALRYFNACGATEIHGEDHEPETHLIPIALQAAMGQRERLYIFGDDYPTPDGTCLRDYIHVLDLAKAHILALEYLERGGGSQAFNLGNGNGFSVLEVIEAARKVTGRKIKAEKAGRRPGDPAVLVASAEKARSVLGWSPEWTSLERIIESAWKWRLANPDGYEVPSRQ